MKAIRIVSICMICFGAGFSLESFQTRQAFASFRNIQAQFEKLQGVNKQWEAAFSQMEHANTQNENNVRTCLTALRGGYR